MTKKITEKFIKINRIPTSRIPDSITSESKLIIGTQLGQNGRVRRPLSLIEEEILLPDIIRVSADDVNFIKEVEKYFEEFSISIPPEGVKLNIATNLRKIKIDDEEQEIAYPVEPEDYIKYLVLKRSNYVAPNPESIYSSPRYTCYLEDLDASLKQQQDTVKIKLKASRLVEELITNSSDVTAKKIKSILEVSRDIHQMDLFDSSVPELTLKIVKFAEKHPEEFYKIATDETLEYKTLIISAVERGYLQKSGNSIINESEVIGDNLDAAAAYLANPTNSNVLVRLKAKINTSI